MKTYSNMNQQIVALLRLDSESPQCLYAAQRIEELEHFEKVLAELEAWLEAERLECETWKRGRAIGKTYWLFLKRMIDKIKELKEKK